MWRISKLYIMFLIQYGSVSLGELKDPDNAKLAIGLQAENTTFVFQVPIQNHIPKLQAFHEVSYTTTSPIITCSQAEVRRLRVEFLNKTKSERMYDRSYCPKETWLRELSSSSNGRNKVIVNVGFNKGYNFAAWMSLFTPWTKVNNSLWYNLMLSSNKSEIPNPCGACNDCLESLEPLNPSKSPDIRSGDLIMFGIDLNDDNLNLISKITSHGIRTNQINFEKVKLYLLNAAASSEIMVTKLPYNCQVGNEKCGLSNKGRDIISLPIDQLVPRFKEKLISTMLGNRNNSLRHSEKMGAGGSTTFDDEEFVIDILQIDAEGHDPAVLQGASQLIYNRKVRCVIFEYHRLNLWQVVNLKDVVREFSHMQYDCFFAGQGRLWPISGTCWDPKYEFKFWSNVLCILRTDPWYTIIQKYIVRVKQHSKSATRQAVGKAAQQ